MDAGRSRFSGMRVLVWSGLFCVLGGAAIVAGNFVTTDFEDVEQADQLLNRTSLLEELESESPCCRMIDPPSAESTGAITLTSAESSCPSACSAGTSCSPGKNCSSVKGETVVTLNGPPLDSQEKSAHEIVQELTQGGPVSQDLKPLVDEPAIAVETDVEIQLGEAVPLTGTQSACSTVETTPMKSRLCPNCAAANRMRTARAFGLNESQAQNYDSQFLNPSTGSLADEAELRTKLVSSLMNAAHVGDLRAIQTVPYGLGLINDLMDGAVRQISAQISEDKTFQAVDVDLLPPQEIFKPVEDSSHDFNSPPKTIPFPDVPPQPQPIRIAAESEPAECPKAIHLKRAADELDKAGLTDNAAELRKQAAEAQKSFEQEQQRNQPTQLTAGQVQELQTALIELREEVKQLKVMIEGLKTESTAKLNPPVPVEKIFISGHELTR